MMGEFWRRVFNGLFQPRIEEGGFSGPQDCRGERPDSALQSYVKKKGTEAAQELVCYMHH